MGGISVADFPCGIVPPIIRFFFSFIVVSIYKFIPDDLARQYLFYSFVVNIAQAYTPYSIGLAISSLERSNDAPVDGAISL